MIDIRKATSGHFTGPRMRIMWWVPALLFLAVVITWVWATASGRVELSFAGDEAPRLLVSYQ